MNKMIKYQVPSCWLGKGILKDKNFSYIIFLNLLKDSRKSRKEPHRYKYNVYERAIQIETGLSINTVKKKLKYMIDKGFISINEDGVANINRFDKGEYVLITEEELNLLSNLGSKSEYSIRMYIYLKALYFTNLNEDREIYPSLDTIATRIGLSINNRDKIKKISDVLKVSGLIIRNKKWIFDKKYKKYVLRINYFLPISERNFNL